MTVKTSYDDALELVESLYYTGIKLGLENTFKLLSLVDNPHINMRFVHVAGTNGKGSVSSMIESGLRETGLVTGLFTSPHLVSIRERLRLNGKNISKAEFSNLVFFLYERTNHLFTGEKEQKPTFFEFITVLAILCFQKNNVDIAVMEVGMGGRLDSTNVINPLISIITTISLEHTKSLGSNVADIAYEKAGIIKNCTPIICGERNRGVQNVISKIANEKKAHSYFIGNHFNNLKFHIKKGKNSYTQENRVKWKNKKYLIESKLLGRHQCLNVSIAVAALSVLSENKHINLKLSDAINGIKKTNWPGRLEYLSNGLLIDAAHNLAAMTETISAIKTLFPDNNWTVLFAALNDKKWKRMISEVLPFSDDIGLVSINHRNEVNPQVIKQFISRKWDQKKITIFQDIPKAIYYLLEKGNGLVLGSSFLVGKVISASKRRVTIPNDQCDTKDKK